MNFSSISKTASAAILGAVLFTGCGVFSDGDAVEDGGAESTTLKGVAVKGYLKDSNVTVDFNGDGNISSDETVQTDTNGTYTISGELSETVTISVAGGTDVDSGEIFDGVLKAPVEVGTTESVAITPVTTLVAAMVENNVSITTARENTANALGIDIDNLSLDPIVAAQDGNTEILKQSLKVARLFQFIVENSDANQSVNFTDVAESVASTISNSSDDVNLTSAVTTVASTKITDDDKKNAVATLSNALDDVNLTVASDSNTTIDELIKAVEISTSAVTKILTAEPTKEVSMDVITQAIQELSEDLNSTTVINIDTFVEEVKDENLTQKLNPAVISRIKNDVIVNEDEYKEDQETPSVIKTVTVTLTEEEAAAAAGNIANSAPATLKISIENGVVTVEPVAGVTVKKAEVVDIQTVPEEYRAVREVIYYVKITDTIYIKITTEIDDSIFVEPTPESLSITDNQITIGTKTVTVANGEFTLVTNDVTDIEDLMNVSFSFDAANIPTDTTKNIGVAVVLNENGSNRSIEAFIKDGIVFKKDANDVVTVTVAADTNLTVNGTKANNQEVTATITNNEENVYTADANGDVAVDLSNMFDKLDDNFDTDLTAITRTGSFNLKAVIVGIYVNGTKEDNVTIDGETGPVQLVEGTITIN
ncbi:MAG: hypothetical protein U9N59_00015 [Campylobacterota bacterium]|nr:hypothetical protein [Campylobacterota bacterium]